MGIDEQTAEGRHSEKSVSNRKRGHSFLWGIILGLLIGVACGWWASKPQFGEKAKHKVADVTESLSKLASKASKKLRGEGEE